MIPVVPAVLGNFLVPLMIGAKDLAFPRINLLSWYLYVVGGLLISHVMFDRWRRHGLDFLHSIQHGLYQHQDCRGRTRGLHRRFFVHLHRTQFHRHDSPHGAPGLTWDRLPLFIWANYATSLIMILGTPVVAITIVLVAVERLFHLGIFDPRLGGDPRSCSSTCSGSTRTPPSTS